MNSADHTSGLGAQTENPPVRPPTALLDRRNWNRDLSGYTHLFNNSTYEHLLFDLHALKFVTRELDEKPLPLIPKRQSVWTRNIRHIFLNVYRRLFSLVFFLNIIGLCFILSK